MGKILRWVGVGVALLVAGGVIARLAFPKVEEVQLPAETDTVTVTEPQVDSIVREVVRWRERVTTDTVTVTTTRYETDTVYLATLPPRWYLAEASIGARGDTSTYSLVWLEADSTGVRRRKAVERQVTLGPVREIRTDAEGLHVDYAEPKTCPGLLSGDGLGLSLPLGAKLGPGGTAGVTDDGSFGYAIGASVTF